MAQTGGRGLPCVLPGGEDIRILPEHRYISWNPTEYAAFRAAVKRGDVALDVGANVGAYSLALGHWVDASGRVFAFEPSPDIFEALVRHVDLNDLGSVVHPMPEALSDREEAAARFDVSVTSGEGSLVAPGSSAAMTTVAVSTIDRFCNRAGISPDFIKIDVEGWELAVLRGARTDHPLLRSQARALR